ncbi:hypothetical protein [Nocardioides marmotae]|uniref:hypothetical protein n=1 Tax=Nocardioides marmotae TaxID=2663857 RepID=UPI001495867C|nr:hypothetical protein [Nocardioides marmotae]QKE00610.1 hypothetical protein HPC71_05585 [Nocardioides marmotae]
MVWFESLRTVGRNRSLARLLLALTCSVMADAGFVTTAAVWANRAGGPGAVGAFTAATFAVSAVAAPVAALVGDRTARRTFLLVVDSVRLGCAAGAGPARRSRRRCRRCSWPARSACSPPRPAGRSTM